MIHFRVLIATIKIISNTDFSLKNLWELSRKLWTHSSYLLSKQQALHKKKEKKRKRDSWDFHRFASSIIRFNSIVHSSISWYIFRSVFRNRWPWWVQRVSEIDLAESVAHSRNQDDPTLMPAALSCANSGVSALRLSKVLVRVG